MNAMDLKSWALEEAATSRIVRVSYKHHTKCGSYVALHRSPQMQPERLDKIVISKSRFFLSFVEGFRTSFPVKVD